MENDVRNLPDRKFQSHRAKSGLWLDFDKRPVDGRTKLGKAIAVLRASLVKDLGGDLSSMESILVDRVIHKAMKCWFYERNVLDGNNPGSRDHYLACCNSLRLDLIALGLEKKTESTGRDGGPLPVSEVTVRFVPADGGNGGSPAK